MRNTFTVPASLLSFARFTLVGAVTGALVVALLGSLLSVKYAQLDWNAP